MRVAANGETLELEDGATLADLLRRIGAQPGSVAAMVNDAIVPRAGHSTHRLEQDDRVEIVTLVRGG
jgi:sulfur carrier protein